MMQPSAFRTRLVIAALPLLLVMVGPDALQAQVELRGRLLSESGNPVPGATIVVGGIGFSVRSDSSGRFALAGARGATLQLYFTAPGFRRDSASVVLGRGLLERDFTLADASTPAAESNLLATMLRGLVVEENGVPLSYANVQVNYGTRIIADDSGRFQFPYENGTRTLLVRRIGFEPIELRLTAKPDTALRIVLRPIATQLKEVTVMASASAYRSLDIHGFYGRMRDAERGINHGWFITPEDIERRKAANTAQMADGFPSIRVSKSGRGPMWDTILGPQNCAMTIYLDNIRITKRPDDYVNQLVPISHVAAMEIYPRAIGAPPQYQSLNGTCGVILIWTK
jgi:hypothetical protein